ncbi:MAG TPA: phosphatidate cytidylyltransferase [Acholeplasma sp.]|nr:phosphatidate cytidylyltransferase [Acholeplasma sp.]
MKQRVITALILLAVFIPIVIFEPLFLVFQFTMILMVIVGSSELINMYNKEKKMSMIPMVITVLAAIFIYLSAVISWNNDTSLAYLTPIDIKINFVTITMVVTLLMFALMVFYKDYDGSDIGKSMTIIFYIGLSVAAVSILRILGVRFVAYLFIITMATDIFAYFFGVRFGKHKMIPWISPKKSWEGAIAGTVFATIFGVAFALFYGYLFPAGSFLNRGGQMTLLENFSSIGSKALWIQALVIVPVSFIGSIVSQIGDLVASKLKRTYGIKDFGKIFPGHGGILDRFDSAMFVALFLVAVFMTINQIFPIIS